MTFAQIKVEESVALAQTADKAETPSAPPTREAWVVEIELDAAKNQMKRQAERIAELEAKPTAAEVEKAIKILRCELQNKLIMPDPIDILSRAARSSTRPMPTREEIYAALSKVSYEPTDLMCHAQTDAMVALLEGEAKDAPH